MRILEENLRSYTLPMYEREFLNQTENSDSKKDTLNIYKYDRRYQSQWIDDRFVKCVCRYTNSGDSLKFIGHREYIESELT